MLRHAAVAAQQYQLIRDRLQAAEPDLDERTLLDTLEGLTDLHEIIAAIVRGAVEDKALVRGLKDRIGVMQGRLQRLSDRSDKRRQFARDLMVETGVRKITAADFTLSVRPGSPALVVTDEGVIPSQFWEPREPKLNRQALLAELKQGGVVAGVALSNPELVLSVRSK